MSRPSEGPAAPGGLGQRRDQLDPLRLVAVASARDQLDPLRLVAVASARDQLDPLRLVALASALTSSTRCAWWPWPAP